MIERYQNPEIARIWTEKEKVRRWQETELAVIKARENSLEIPQGVHTAIQERLGEIPCDLVWWKDREKTLRHDLNAWLEERLRFIPKEFEQYFHQGMTSYDTEEPAFALMLRESVRCIMELKEKMLNALRIQAWLFRYTPMNKRTHGQEAELGSFGARCLTWHQELAVTGRSIAIAIDNLRYSKLSGAIGTYSGVSPQIEELALEMLELKPFYGATQIMPRVLYAPLASALADLVTVLDKIATDFRLGARSGRPLWHEPFGKKQKSSSAMPHKKNTISTEQVGGLARMARSYAVGIKENILTWEERAIEQSCVERVFWPDLFHVTARALSVMERVISKMVVYPDNMLREIIDSKGCYASNEAKEFLAQHGTSVGIGKEDAYRIVQLAAFIAFAPRTFDRGIRENPPSCPEKADELLEGQRDAEIKGAKMLDNDYRSIQDLIVKNGLRRCEELEATGETVAEWTQKLGLLFADYKKVQEWNELFKPSRALKRESFLFEKLF